MKKAIIVYMSPLFLTGCIGSIISGETSHLCDDYPDIRSVPERCEASKPRGLHACDEKEARAAELFKLEQDREQIKERNKALREEQ
jgi:hypothetical protein